MKQWQSWFSKNIARNVDSADTFLLLWSFFWSYNLLAPGRPEVPTVPETVQVQGWPQLPHYGWTHNQGTQHTNPKFAVRFSLLAVASKLIFDQSLPPRSSLKWGWDLIFLHWKHWPTECVSQGMAIQKLVVLVIVFLMQRWVWLFLVRVCNMERPLIDLSCKLSPTSLSAASLMLRAEGFIKILSWYSCIKPGVQPWYSMNNSAQVVSKKLSWKINEGTCTSVLLFCHMCVRGFGYVGLTV